MNIKKAILERRELRVDHLVVGCSRVGCIAVVRLNVTASFESMNARLKNAELHDGVLLLKVDALEEFRVLSTLSHRELKNTRVDVMLDGIVQVSMVSCEMVAPQLDEDFFHAACLCLNVSDYFVRTFGGRVRALKGVDDVAHVCIEVVHLVRGLAQLCTELFHDGEALGDRVELECRDTARLLVGDDCRNFGGGLCWI